MKKKGLLIGSTILYGVSAVAAVYSVMLLGDIIDYAESGSMDSLIKYLIYCLILFLGYLGMSAVGIAFRMNYVSSNMVHLKKEMVKKILSMSISGFKKHDHGYYVNCLNGDADKVEEDFFCTIPIIAFYLCQLICSIVALIGVSYILMLAYLVFFAITFLIPQTVTRKLSRCQVASSLANEKAVAAYNELIEGYETIKLNGSEAGISSRNNVVIEEQQKNRSRLRGWRAFNGELSSVSGSVSQLICIAFGGYFVIKGIITVGSLIIAIQLVNYCFESINSLGEKISSINAVKPVLKKVKMEEVENLSFEKIERSVKKGNLIYENVSFSYDKKPIVKNFSYEFEEGKAYAVIGESGAGKSTLMKLLLKYNNLDSGNIYIGEKNVAEIPDRELYDRVGYTAQDSYLFNDGLRENITMFKPADAETYNAVLCETCIDELATNLAETKIGDFGNRLSGGERQRVVVARALMSRPDILILDEPTASLDPETGTGIMEMILGLKNITRIVITHDQRPEVLRKFDGVINI